MMNIRIDDSISREEEAARESHSGHETLRQAEEGSVIAPNYQDLVDFSKKYVSIYLSFYWIEDKYQEDQGKPERGGVVTPQNGTTIHLAVTTAYDPMLVDNTDNESVLTIAIVDKPKQTS